MENLRANDRTGPWPQTSVGLGAKEPDGTKTETDQAQLLTELHALLENYAPPWYTEHLHERTEELLRILGWR